LLKAVIKTTPPNIPVITPMGNSLGAIIVLARMSLIIKKIPPSQKRSQKEHPVICPNDTANKVGDN